MSAEKQKRKRVVASCTQCYSKKQKCNHQYPCNHCTRRRRPELCVFASHDPTTEDEELQEMSKADSQRTTHPEPSELHKRRKSLIDMLRNTGDSGDYGEMARPSNPTQGSTPIFEASLPACFGYFEGSKSNLLGLMQGFNILGDGRLEGGTVDDSSMEYLVDIKRLLQQLPKRPVLDRLLQNFFKEVNWIYEMIHPTTFLTHYEDWWNGDLEDRVHDVGFGVLMLRVCAYSAQFLPSRAYTADTICGASLSKIREHCHKLATDLSNLCHSAGSRSLTSVQHLYFAACYSKNEGRMKEAWFMLGHAIRLAQDLGMHLEPSRSSQPQLDDLEKDMRRRAFWNLYIWDRFLSLVLDRLPCIVDDNCSVTFPKMRLVTGTDDPKAPDISLERVLQARLIKLWYSMYSPTVSQPATYDPAIVEENYEKLRRDFISTLPNAFAFTSPDTQWDEQIPMLIRQRYMLHISVLVILCQLLRPLLRLTISEIQAMPQYKRNLLLTHRGFLVDAAISLLDSISGLHENMGGNQTRYFLLSFYTFEPAMILGMHLLSIDLALEALRQARTSSDTNRLWKTPIAFEAASHIHADRSSVTECRKQMEKAYERLQMLCEVSTIAAVGTQTLGRMMAQIDSALQTNYQDQHDPGDATIPDTGLSTLQTIDSALTFQGNRTEPWVDLNTMQDGWLDDSAAPYSAVSAWGNDHIDQFLGSNNPTITTCSPASPTEAPTSWNSMHLISGKAGTDSSRFPPLSHENYGTASEKDSAGSPQSSLFNYPTLGDVALQQMPTSLGVEAPSNYLSTGFPLNQQRKDNESSPSYRVRAEPDWDAFVSHVPSNRNNGQQGIGMDQYPTSGQSSLLRDNREGTSSIRG